MAVFKKWKKFSVGGFRQDNAEEVRQDPGNEEESEKITKLDSLTPKEYEELYWLLQGHTLKEAAEKMNVKYSTANTHMTNIYKKLGVKTRAELIIQYKSYEKYRSK